MIYLFDNILLHNRFQILAGETFDTCGPEAGKFIKLVTNQEMDDPQPDPSPHIVAELVEK